MAETLKELEERLEKEGKVICELKRYYGGKEEGEILILKICPKGEK